MTNANITKMPTFWENKTYEGCVSRGRCECPLDAAWSTKIFCKSPLWSIQDGIRLCERNTKRQIQSSFVNKHIIKCINKSLSQIIAKNVISNNEWVYNFPGERRKTSCFVSVFHTFLQSVFFCFPMRCEGDVCFCMDLRDKYSNSGVAVNKGFLPLIFKSCA